MDAWFTLGRSGQLEVLDRSSQDADGWDVARQLLADQIDVSNRWVLGIVFNAVTKNLTLVRSHEFRLRYDLFRAQMDLLELDVRAERLRKKIWSGPSTPGMYEDYRAVLQVIGDGWDEVVSTLSHEAYRKQFLMAAGDVGLYLSGVAIFRGIGAGFRWLGSKLTGKTAEATASKLYAEQLARAGERVAESSRRAGGGPAVALHSFQVSAREKVSLALRALESRGQMARWVAHSLRVSGQVLHESVGQLPYVGVSQGTQLLAEVWNRRDVIFDPNPIVLTKNILSDKDLIQNLVFMTNETFLMAGVSSYYAGLGKRMRICGAIALVDSAASSILVKNSTDPARMALDASYEAIIGNAQVQLDVAAMDFFTRLSQKSGQPKLRLVGYAFAFVDQLAGYIAYGKLSELYEKRKADREGTQRQKPEEPSSAATLVMLPLYAPIGP
jgi:hypothetical protein